MKEEPCLLWSSTRDIRISCGDNMEAQDVKCIKCGGKGKIHGSDYTDEFGPFYIACLGCGEETVIWAYPREAWQAWKQMNSKDSGGLNDKNEAQRRKQRPLVPLNRTAQRHPEINRVSHATWGEIPSFAPI